MLAGNPLRPPPFTGKLATNNHHAWKRGRRCVPAASGLPGAYGFTQHIGCNGRQGHPGWASVLPYASECSKALDPCDEASSSP
ncbi:uncharacterized protein UV8b_03388 [Ustilaginoidea virens]|uniref:Uncharacterized protein n=1 Tax=Ustilaginoidea virens TaxID=1159556 RepID=A0A8E5MH25_USTVR|nr:uncharacterized protein UV8b_03388 [Ustilaginoidea virens]QUC19147.1 hypothetical protein UV8b_03388 [Ustilaginoidea virens]